LWADFYTFNVPSVVRRTRRRARRGSRSEDRARQQTCFRLADRDAAPFWYAEGRVAAWLEL